jgi:DNA-directed RNA polymerase specialized sigma24 family protein
MAAHPDHLLRQLRRIVNPPSAQQLPDASLLDRFLHGNDEDAFAALVTRHGPMVLGVCRRVLRNRHEAEDAAQATFVVLARKAATIGRPDALPAWLHRTAYRLALLSRRAETRRREREGRCFPDATLPPDPSTS